MANYPIYRQVKGSPLTFQEMDGNLEWLSRTMSASIVTITGSTFVLGNLNVSDGITGSLFGTSSWAINTPLTFPYSGSAQITGSLGITGSTNIIGNLKVSSEITASSFLITSSQNVLEAIPKFRIGDDAGDYVSIWPGKTSGTTELFMRGNNPFYGSAWSYSITTGYNITHSAGGYVENLCFNMGSNNAITLKGSGNVIMGGSTDTTLYKLDVLSKDARINGLRVGRGPNNQIENTVVGDLAFVSNLTGTRNTVVGFEALYSNTSGRYNTAYGMDALYYNSVGQENVAIGYAALQSNRSGSFNTILGGSLTAYEITSGSYNTIIGTNSGRVITIGNNNTIIGGRLNNSYTPGAPFTTTMSDNVILGDGKGYIRYRFDGTKNNFYDNTVITGSVTATLGFTGSLFGTSSWAVSASWAPTTPAFPYTGSARITGSLFVEGPVGFTGSLANGFNNNASGSYSHAEGYETIASGVGSHAEGFRTVASNFYSHAEGRITTASGNYAHAEGNAAIASSDYAHAEGDATNAAGFASHAEGTGTTAFNLASHAEGSGTTALGVASHAEGLGTVASGSYQHVQGQYNISSSGAQSAFIIGNGTSNLNRSNLVFASGSSFQITGSLNVSGSITGSLFGTSSWAVSASWAPSTGGVSGTYTPTLAAVYNVASSGSYELQYMRVGNVVTVGGAVELAATAANTWTRLAISLPISSTFDFSYRAGGGGAANATNNTCGILAEAFSGTRVFLDSYPNTTGVLNYFFSFTYLIM